MPFDWTDAIKVGGGFVSGIAAMVIREAIRDHFQARAEKRASLNNVQTENRKAFNAKQRDIVDTALNLIHEAKSAADGLYHAHPWRDGADDEAARKTLALRKFYQRNMHYLPPAVRTPLGAIGLKLFEADIKMIQLFYSQDGQQKRFTDLTDDERKTSREIQILLDEDIPTLMQDFENAFKAMLGV